MSEERLKERILEAWRSHVSTVPTELDESGKVINNIDDSRLYAIEVVKIIIHNYLKGDFDIHDFKTALDSYNKHNNLWGFTAKLGQMYFNQIIKANEGHIDKLNNLLKEAILEPKNLRDALSKIEALEKMTLQIYTRSKDKHNAPYPGAVGFFLSYFWQIYNPQKWPILYNTLISSFKELGMWEDQKTQKETYEHYYAVYNDVKKIIEEESGRKVTYWEIEHALWNYKPKPVVELLQVQTAKENFIPSPSPVPASAVNPSTLTETATTETKQTQIKTELPTDFREYLMPRLSRLLDRDFRQDQAQPGSRYENLVLEAFAQLGFDVEILDQSKEKNAFAILRFRSEDVAFIVDANPSSDEYFRSADRRVIKEYVNDSCTNLKREGYKKIGYLVVCNSFDAQYQTFVSYINWNTDIKRATLLSTEALLYMLAFKIKNRYKLYDMIERIAGFSQLVDAGNIASELREYAAA